jgi:hypothetical protein
VQYRHFIGGATEPRRTSVDTKVDGS